MRWSLMVMPNIEAAGITKEEAIRALKEDHIVPVGQAGTFNPIKSQGFNPQYAEVMQIMLSLIDEIGGGKTFSGNANSTHQSGKAVNMLVAQGQMLTDAFIDNRNRFLQDLGRKTLYQIKKYDSAPYVARIEGGSLSPEMLQLLQQDNQFIQSKENPAAGYLKMNEGGSNYLEDAEFDLDIVEESQNENKMAMEYEMMGQIEQSDEDLKLSPTWRKKKLEHIPNLDYSDRNKIIKEITDAKTAQAQQVQQQQQHANDMEKTKMLHEISKNKNVNKQQQPANAQ